MLNTVVGALLPIVVTLVFGFFAAWHKDFTADQASVLNRMVMLYALPLSLFAGMVTTKRGQLTSDLGLAAAIAGAMLGSQLVTIVIARFLLHRSLGFSALAGLAVGGPAVPFVGVSVLGYLFGSASTVPIAVASLVMNIIQVPLTLVLLSIGAAPARAKPMPAPARAKQMAAAPADAKPTGAASAGAGPMAAAPAGAKRSGGPASGGLGLGRHLVAALKEPVVWAPVAALALVLAGVSVSPVLDSSLKLLGSTTGGVALFASGIILYAQRVTLSWDVIAIVAARNVIVPGVLWAVLAAVGVSHMVLREAVLTSAIPVASIVVILAVQYKQAQREMASSLFLSNVLSILTMGAFIALT